MFTDAIKHEDNIDCIRWLETRHILNLQLRSKRGHFQDQTGNTKLEEGKCTERA